MAEIDKLAIAMNNFQAELVSVGKTAQNPFFKSKYADLGSIMKEAQPVLTKHGLSVIQLPSNIEGQPALTTIIMHLSGQSIEATSPLILAKQDPQGLGSAITYQRRYAYAAALQIVIDEDDDGNKASRPQARTAAPAIVSNVFPGATTVPTPSEPMMTDIQKRQLKAFLTASGVEDAEHKQFLYKEFGVTPDKITKAKASEIIDFLK